MQIPPKIDVYGLSLRGDDHDRNHDHFAIATLNKSLRLHQSNLTVDDQSRMHGTNQGHLFLVADGVSACPAPSRASGTAVDSVVQYFLNEMPWYHLVDGAPEDVTLALEDALRNAQSELLRTGGDGNLGTTLTLAFVFWPHLYLAHAGDSRCYLSRDGELRQLTTDRAPASVRKATAARLRALARRDQNTLLRPEVGYQRLQVDDRIALVTDGVVREQSEDRLQRLMDRDESAEELCGRLVDVPGDDDRTAIFLRFLPTEDVGVSAEQTATLPSLEARRKAPENKSKIPNEKHLVTRRADPDIRLAR